MKIFSYALSWLASQDYSEQKIREKLQKKFPHQDQEREAVIEKLKQEKYIDDYRYTINHINFWKEHSHYSKSQIKQKLFTRKISKETIETVLQDIEISDATALQKLCEHKWNILRAKDISEEKRKEKLFRYLLGKGFSWNDIQIAFDITLKK